MLHIIMNFDISIKLISQKSIIISHQTKYNTKKREKKY